MSKLRILLVFSGVLAAGAASADKIVVAEFRADQSGVSGSVSPDISQSEPVSPDAELYGPGNLYSEEIGDSREHSWSIGDYTLSGVMDWGYRTNYLAGDRYSDEQYVTMGSKVLLGDSSETYLYHGFGQDQSGYAADLYGGLGDAETTRTGLAQTMYFLDHQAQVGVGYEYATGDREQLYQGLEGHQVNVSGQVDIGWGFSAHLEAAYGLYSYSEYDGVRGDLTSARKNMRAGISRSFTPSLSWGLHYSYIDEEFELSELSQSRQTWGLNLQYRY